MYFYSVRSDLVGYSDADWVNDSIDRKSVSGYHFKLFDNLICWSSKKMVTLSSTESEFVAVRTASCELLDIINLLADLKIDLKLPVVLLQDNQSTIKLLQNFENDKRCKQVVRVSGY